MALSVNSKIKEIMKVPEAVDVCEKYMPGFKTDKQMKMVYGLTLAKLASFPQANIAEETLAQIDKELAELG